MVFSSSSLRRTEAGSSPELFRRFDGPPAFSIRAHLSVAVNNMRGARFLDRVRFPRSCLFSLEGWRARARRSPSAVVVLARFLFLVLSSGYREGLRVSWLLNAVATEAMRRQPFRQAAWAHLRY